MEVTITIPTWLLWVIGIPLGIIILFVFVIGLVLCCKLIFSIIISMEIKDIINDGRPIEPYCFETDNEVTWYKIGANDGYEYALEEFENNRLKACESQTEAEAERELSFAIKFFEEHHRQPTFSDAIEVTRKQMIDKAYKWIEYYNNNGGCLFDGWKDDFRKTMEE